MSFDFICLYFAKIFSAIFSIGGPMNLLSFTATPLPSAFASAVSRTISSAHATSSSEGEIYWLNYGRSFGLSTKMILAFYVHFNITPPQLKPTPKPDIMTLSPVLIILFVMQSFNPISTVELTVLPVSARLI